VPLLAPVTTMSLPVWPGTVYMFMPSQREICSEIYREDLQQTDGLLSFPDASRPPVCTQGTGGL
jgi:hypothetical protein